MSELRKAYTDLAYFITFTTVGWIDVFTRKELADIIISRTCSDQKAVAWALARVTNICEASGRVDANAFENIQNIF